MNWASWFVSFNVASGLLVGAPGEDRELYFTLHRDSDPMTFGVAGPADEKFVLERSHDLQAWTILQTNQLAGYVSEVRFLLDAQNGQQAFYRARRYDVLQDCDTGACFEEHVPPDATECPIRGDPDLPYVRDSFIPSPLTQVRTIRLMIHVLDNDEGNNAAATDEDVWSQMITLNDHYRPWRIQFVHQFQVVRSSSWRQLHSFEHAAEMREFLSEQTNEQHNVFVTGLWTDRLMGFSTYPWSTNALLSKGGTVIRANRFGGGQVTLTHELGHALGLLHTHHGFEYSTNYDDPCWPCWERADGAKADTTGDRCSDTVPTPLDSNGQPIGSDTCPDPDLPWPTNNLANVMSAAPWTGQPNFTPQQAGRMHAWINYALTGWLDLDTPAGPSDLRVEANAFGGVTLHWTDNAWNETGFVVERTGPNGAPTTTPPLPANTTRFEDLNTAASTGYTYRVWAINGATNSYPSLTVAARTRADPRVLCVIPDMAEPPGDWECDGLFTAVGQAYDAAPTAEPTIIRIKAGEYHEVLKFEKLLRLEAAGGAVVIGIP